MYDSLYVQFHIYTRYSCIHMPIDCDLTETIKYCFDPYTYWTVIYRKKKPRNNRNHDEPCGPYQTEKAIYNRLTQQHE